MKWNISTDLEAKIDALVRRYPQKRSAAVMALHAIQECDGYIQPQAMEWLAKKLEIQPIHVLELVTFYPMFRQKPVGQFHFKICRTLSCALNGSHELRDYLCDQFGLNKDIHGLQTSADGAVTVEFVECLAACGTAPAMMCNDTFHASVNMEKLKKLTEKCPKQPEKPKMAAEHGFEP